MFFSSVYFFLEAIKNLYRNLWMSIASIGVVAITLLMLGGFMIVSLNTTYLTGYVKEQVEIVLYISENASTMDRNELHRKLSDHSGLAEVRFVSREEAMERLREQFGEQGDFLEGYESAEHNPLPDSYEIRVIDPETVSEIALELESYPGVEDVNYGREVVEKLFSATRVIQMVIMILMAGLAVTAIFLISHTIRLNVYIRRKEIMIMKYVGATNWFIRWPFLLEGFILGLLGASLPLLVLYFIYDAAYNLMVNNIAFFELISLPVIMNELLIYLLPLGIGLGVFGSLLSMGRFLRV